MFSATVAYREFMRRWSVPGCPLEKVKEPDLKSVERDFNCWLPADYREAVLEFGVGKLSAAFPAAVQSFNVNLDLIAAFLDPSEMLQFCKQYASINDVSGFIPIAAGTGGEFWGFARDDLAQPKRPESGMIWYSNFETGDSKFCAGDFESWIMQYDGVPLNGE
ncbi:SMI1/KNR4 family protein [Aestuariivirga sp.]|uniref:SMI1/KNR4 family protein n=1 Tax=Aestuariivirga sp. TaxID=2650926 RepID=UPI0039E40612